MRTSRKTRRKRAVSWLLIAVLVIEVLAICFGAYMVGDALSEDGVWYTATVDDYANIREQPDKNSADTGDLVAGEEVLGIGYQSGWVLIEYSVEAKQGWVREDFLTLSGIPVGRYKNTSGGFVKVRREPGGKWIGKIETNHSVNVERWVYANESTWGYIGFGYVKYDLFTENP